MSDDKLTQAVSAAIRRADPYGLIGGGAPTDEYDGEVATIVEQLKATPPTDQSGVRAIVFSVFEQSFGSGSVGPIEAYDQAAAEIWLGHRSVDGRLTSG